MAHEVNFDGLVGPTHNYAGLAFGNRAAMAHATQVANPRAACLEGLAKMKYLMDIGLPQAFLPPPPRPNLAWLRQLGFQGTDQTVLTACAKQSPQLLAASYSAASMWAANSATICPSQDSVDGKVHLTPANLINQLHRSHEADFTHPLFQQIFSDPQYFTVHSPLPSHTNFSDEGAANHMRLQKPDGSAVHLFVYGQSETSQKPTHYPTRQHRLACEAIIRQHQLSKAHVILAQQLPAAIDAGVFHNDVIAVTNGAVLFCHEQAWVDQAAIYRQLGDDCLIIEVPASTLSLETVVNTYLFNSQLVTLSTGEMALIAPSECEENLTVKTYLDDLVQATSNPIGQIHYINCRQSMNNGGGPACLRLRILLEPDEWTAVPDAIKFTQAHYDKLVQFVNQHYRDHLSPHDLADPLLMQEALEIQRNLQQLTTINDID